MRSWVRAAAIRTAISLLRKDQREVLLNSRSLEALPASPVQDPSLNRLKSEYRQEFQRAFSATLERLSPEDRTLLRLQFVDGLSIDDLGSVLGVHRATAARRLQAIRDKLARGTKDLLMAELGLSPNDVESVIRLIQSNLAVSLRRHLVAPLAVEKKPKN